MGGHALFRPPDFWEGGDVTIRRRLDLGLAWQREAKQTGLGAKSHLP